MSARRGLEVHNGYAILPDLTTKIQIGTRSAPITQTEAMEAVVSGWVSSSADGIGWDLHGGHFGVYAAVDRDGDVVGVEGRAYVNDGIQIGGNAFGGHVRAYALGASIIDKDFEGLHIYMNTDPLSTVTGFVAAIRIESNIRKNPVGRQDIIRLREDGTQDIDAFIYTEVGALGNINYFLETFSGNRNAWRDTGQPTHTTEYGWIRVRIGGAIRYILLYDTAP